MEIIVLAVPSSVILDVVNDLIPHLRPGHVLLDLAKGLAPKKRLISSTIEQILKENVYITPLLFDRTDYCSGAANGVVQHWLLAKKPR